MGRTLPVAYAGWQEHRAELKVWPTAQLVREVQDGPPARRMAALSVIHVTDLSQELLEDWVRTLPEPEANELLGAITARQANSSCRDALRWAAAGRLGYERRRLPTFLVMLFRSLEALESSACAECSSAWEVTADWLVRVYDSFVAVDGGRELEDISLFVFENYLDRAPVFEAFCSILARHPELALAVSSDPGATLALLPEAQQRAALLEAALGGGLPLAESWRRLHPVRR